MNINDYPEGTFTSDSIPPLSASVLLPWHRDKRWSKPSLATTQATTFCRGKNDKGVSCTQNTLHRSMKIVSTLFCQSWNFLSSTTEKQADSLSSVVVGREMEHWVMKNTCGKCNSCHSVGRYRGASNHFLFDFIFNWIRISVYNPDEVVLLQYPVHSLASPAPAGPHWMLWKPMEQQERLLGRSWSRRIQVALYDCRMRWWVKEMGRARGGSRWDESKDISRG